MYFWKIDDQTIRCLINREEIDQMGFDINTIGNDSVGMTEFLNAIVRNSKNYISWDSGNGIQNYVARALPSDQFLFTISCMLPDEAIDRDLDQIKKMTTALREKISEERIDNIYKLSGEEKEKEFEALAKDLHGVCAGNPQDVQQREDEMKEAPAVPKAQASETTEDGAEQIDVRPHIPPQKILFSHFKNLLDFCSLLSQKYFVASRLYKDNETYVLLVDFPLEMENTAIISFLITAEEYGGECSNQRFDEYFLSEHAKVILKEDAVEILHYMN